jgi:hypothetical protein
MAALVGAERLARADAAHALVRPGTPGGQSQTKWQAFTRQCGAGDLRTAFRPANSIKRTVSSASTSSLPRSLISTSAPPRASARAPRGPRTSAPPTAGSPDRPIARANTSRMWVSVAFRLPLLWTAPILAGKRSSMSNAIIDQQGDSPGEPSSVQPWSVLRPRELCAGVGTV